MASTSSDSAEGTSSGSSSKRRSDDNNLELSEEESEHAAAGSSRKKFKGAAVYKTKYNQQWEHAFPFIKLVKGNPHVFHLQGVPQNKFLCSPR